jgi:hypothetical protein
LCFAHSSRLTFFDRNTKALPILPCSADGSPDPVLDALTQRSYEEVAKLRSTHKILPVPARPTTKQIEEDSRLIVHALAGLLNMIAPTLWSAITEDAGEGAAHDKGGREEQHMRAAQNIGGLRGGLGPGTTGTMPTPPKVAKGSDLRADRETAYLDFEARLAAAAEAHRLRASVSGLVMNRWDWKPAMEEKARATLKRNVEVLQREHENVISNPPPALDEVWPAAGGRGAEIARTVSILPSSSSGFVLRVGS